MRANHAYHANEAYRELVRLDNDHAAIGEAWAEARNEARDAERTTDRVTAADNANDWPLVRARAKRVGQHARQAELSDLALPRLMEASRRNTRPVAQKEPTADHNRPFRHRQSMPICGPSQKDA